MIGKLTHRNDPPPESLALTDEPSLTPRYTRPAIIAHWLIALLMIGNIVLGLVAEKLPDDRIRLAIDTHKSIGIIVLGLVAMRTLWRLGHKPPLFSQSMAPWERGLAHATHLGLGLYIAKLIVEAHGGDISVASNDQTGTTFALRLPRS